MRPPGQSLIMTVWPYAARLLIYARQQIFADRKGSFELVLASAWHGCAGRVHLQHGEV